MVIWIVNNRSVEAIHPKKLEDFRELIVEFIRLVENRKIIEFKHRVIITNVASVNRRYFLPEYTITE
jgi:hypothetical protein